MIRTFDEKPSTAYSISYSKTGEVTMMSDKNQNPYWLPCPACKELSDVKVYEDTVLLKFPFYCPKCNQKSAVNMVRLRMTVESRDDKC